MVEIVSNLTNNVTTGPAPNLSGPGTAYYVGMFTFFIILFSIILFGAFVIYYFYFKDDTPDFIYSELRDTYKDTEKMCKQNMDRRYKPKRFFWFDFIDLLTTYTPVYIISHPKDSSPVIKKVGGYNGETYTQDGYLCIRLNRWFLGLFDYHKLVKLSAIDKIKIHSIAAGGKDEEKTIEVPQVKILKGNDAIVILSAVDIVQRSESGFYYPILVDEKGKIIDLFVPNFENERDCLAHKLNYELTEQYSQNVKRATRMNPNITQEEILNEIRPKKTEE